MVLEVFLGDGLDVGGGDFAEAFFGGVDAGGVAAE